VTPLERVARVLCEIDGGDPDEVRHGALHAAGQTWLGWEAHAADARKVIAAIREPSEAMVKAGNASKPYNVTGHCEGTIHPVVQRAWPVMIDALLDESDAGR